MEQSTIVLIIMLGALILFLIPKVPILLTCMTICVTLYFSGVATPAEALAGFGNVATWSIIGMSMMTGAFFSTGLGATVGDKLFRLTRGNRKATIVGIYLTAAVISGFTSSLAVVLMLGPMVDALSARSHGELPRKMCWMPMAIGALLGGNTSLMGATNMLTTSGILEETTGRTLGFFAPLSIGFPPILVGLVFYATIGIKLMDRVFDFPDVPVPLSAAAGAAPQGGLSGKAKLSAVIMAVTVAVMILNRWNMGLVTFAAAALMLATRCCTVQEAVDAVKWDIVLQLATMIGFAGVINSSGAGLRIGTFILKITDRLGLCR